MKRSNKKDSKAYEDYLNFDNAEESEPWTTSEGYPDNELEETIHENYSDWEHQVMDQEPEITNDSFNNNSDTYRSRREYQRQLQATAVRTPNVQEKAEMQLNDQPLVDAEAKAAEPKLQRAKYSAKVDRFLTNGIIVVTVLLIAVLLIAFLV